jgi:hypothetical protein
MPARPTNASIASRRLNSNRRSDRNQVARATATMASSNGNHGEGAAAVDAKALLGESR